MKDFITFKPASDYSNLLHQARALHTVCNTLARQNVESNKKIDQLELKLSLMSEAAINAERSTNEMLTNIIEGSDKVTHALPRDTL